LAPIVDAAPTSRPTFFPMPIHLALKVTRHDRGTPGRAEPVGDLRESAPAAFLFSSSRSTAPSRGVAPGFLRR